MVSRQAGPETFTFSSGLEPGSKAIRIIDS